MSTETSSWVILPICTSMEALVVTECFPSGRTTCLTSLRARRVSAGRARVDGGKTNQTSMSREYQPPKPAVSRLASRNSVLPSM